MSLPNYIRTDIDVFNAVHLLMGYDIDKNVITRIERQQRYVTDIELQALCQLFNISFEDFVSNEKKN